MRSIRVKIHHHLIKIYHAQPTNSTIRLHLLKMWDLPSRCKGSGLLWIWKSQDFLIQLVITMNSHIQVLESIKFSMILISAMTRSWDLIPIKSQCSAPLLYSTKTKHSILKIDLASILNLYWINRKNQS